jgi:hypothetical protein
VGAEAGFISPACGDGELEQALSLDSILARHFVVVLKGTNIDPQKWIATIKAKGLRGFLEETIDERFPPGPMRRSCAGSSTKQAAPTRISCAASCR